MKDRPIDPDTLSSNLAIRPADVRMVVEQERHNQDMAKKVKKPAVHQPTPDELQLMYAMEVGPMHAKFLNDEVIARLYTLQRAGYCNDMSVPAHPTVGGPSDTVLMFELSAAGKHVVRATKMTPGDVENLIALAESASDFGNDIPDQAVEVLKLYAILLRKFVLRGNTTDLHSQTAFALDRFERYNR